MEIGNLVWLDLDGDGIQDPGETPLEGVTVTLYDDQGNVVATTTTDANGEYYFDSGDGVDANTDYVIDFDVSTNVTPLPGGFTNADLADTFADETTTGDDSDSDVVNGEIAVTTGDPGASDHTLDAGFVLPYDMALEKIGPTNVDTTNQTVTFDIIVTNQATAVTDFEITDYLAAIGDASWGTPVDATGQTAPVDVDYDGTPDVGTELSWTWTSGTAAVTGQLPFGQSVTIPITISWSYPLPTSPSPLENWAEISAMGGDNPVTDIDSTPDADQADDNQPGAPGDPTDGEIDESGVDGGDEDDHDVAPFEPPPLEPAITLEKQTNGAEADTDTLNDGSEDPASVADGASNPIATGDAVTWTFQIENTGNVALMNVALTDATDVANSENHALTITTLRIMR